MDLKSVLMVFGHNAGYAAAIIVAVVLGLIVVAFWQGREINFWPPKIGERPHPKQFDPVRLSDATATLDVGGTIPAPRLTGAAKIFEVGEAKEFYDAIAPNYDQRNSPNLLVTHMETITRIRQALVKNSELNVLDLGGGTGQHIATHFFNEENIRWTYVDTSSAMVERVHQHLARRPLHKHLTVLMEDINQIHLLELPIKSYDIVLLSLVLTSMPQLPDFAKIAEFLAPGGLLIVSDINPLYTQDHPYYEAVARDGTLVAMRMNPVQPLEVIKRAKAAGLQLSDVDQIGEGVSYSFIATFMSPWQGGGDYDRKADKVMPA